MPVADKALTVQVGVAEEAVVEVAAAEVAEAAFNCRQLRDRSSALQSGRE